MDRIEFVKERVRDSIELKKAILEDEALVQTIADVSQVCLDAYKRGNKLMIGLHSLLLGGQAVSLEHKQELRQKLVLY